jgi:hypothetical protein
MARPLYENKETLRKEVDFAKKVAALFQGTLVKLPIYYNIDYVLVKDGNTRVLIPDETNIDEIKALVGRYEVDAFLEFKCRNVLHRQYDTFILSSHKFEAGVRNNHLYDKPFLVCVRYTDSDTVYKYRKEHSWPIKLGGRWDRGDFQDIEPVVHIPTDELKPF